jgi:hypothetical protein
MKTQHENSEKIKLSTLKRAFLKYPGEGQKYTICLKKAKKLLLFVGQASCPSLHDQ